VAENVADEDFLFHPDAQLLEALGHAVLEANAPGGALRAAGTHQDPIHLPLTDVIMPRMAVASCTSPLPRRDPATSPAPS
jgi:CheY-like chemotaxis protein